MPLQLELAGVGSEHSSGGKQGALNAGARIERNVRVLGALRSMGFRAFFLPFIPSAVVLFELFYPCKRRISSSFIRAVKAGREMIGVRGTCEERLRVRFGTWEEVISVIASARCMRIFLWEDIIPPSGAWEPGAGRSTVWTASDRVALSGKELVAVLSRCLQEQLVGVSTSYSNLLFNLPISIWDLIFHKFI